MKTIDLSSRIISDGKQDHHKCIQDALRGGQVTVILPAGHILVSKTLKVDSHTKIIADERTVVQLAPGVAKCQEDWLLTNVDHINGNSDIEVTGGIWDANGAFNPRGEEEFTPGTFGGVAINLIKVEGLVLRDLTVANADCFFIRLGEVEDFTLEQIKLFNNVPKINQDGVHLGGFCRNGRIRGLRAISPMTPGDDLVAINADDDVTRHFNQGLRRGPIENIHIEDLYAESAYSFVRLLSMDQAIRHIRIQNLRGGVRNNFLNVNRWRFPPGGGNISDVRVSDVVIHKMPQCPPAPDINPAPLCDINLKIDDFEIEDFRRTPLDNGTGNTFEIDPGAPSEFEFEKDATSMGFEMGDDRCSLSDGGFSKLVIRSRTI